MQAAKTTAARHPTAESLTEPAADRPLIADIQRPQLSVVVPVFNESGNLAPLVAEIEQSLAGRMRFEIVIVDDGSSDGTALELAELEQEYAPVRAVSHSRNRGQSAAIHSGVEASLAPIVAVLDGDGQNDPADLPAMFGRLNCADGVRMVIGERRDRRDSAVKRWSSKLANAVRSRVLNDNVRDTGCGLKVFYRADFVRLPAFDHMHRFLPVLLQRDGGRILSTPVSHRPRVRGTSKYGINNRLWAGIVDLLGVLWLTKRGIK